MVPEEQHAMPNVAVSKSLFEGTYISEINIIYLTLHLIKFFWNNYYTDLRLSDTATNLNLHYIFTQLYKLIYIFWILLLSVLCFTSTTRYTNIFFVRYFYLRRQIKHQGQKWDKMCDSENNVAYLYICRFKMKSFQRCLTSHISICV